MIEAAFFYLFAAVMLGAGLMVVVSRNPVFSVLFLILAFFNAAGLFVLIGAEFIAMLLVVVYVGAVAVLFLFVVMMLDINFAEMRAGFQKYLPLGLVVGGILVFELVAAIYGDAFSGATLPAMPEISNTRALGNVLYTKYLYLFQIAGLILLVAMIGAISLTMRRRAGVRRQVIAEQNMRRREDSVEVIDVPVGAAARTVHTVPPSKREDKAMLELSLNHYLAVSAVLFALGAFGIFLNRKNVITILMSIELMLLAVNINMVAFSAYNGDLEGQIFSLFILTVAAAEAAIGLAILVVFFRNRGSIAVEDVNMMKG